MAPVRNLQTIQFASSDRDELRYFDRLQQLLLTESVDPAKVDGSAEARASGSTASTSAAPERAKKAHPKGSGAQRRKARAAAPIGARPSEGLAEGLKAKATRQASVDARRKRKYARREERRLLAALTTPGDATGSDRA